MLNPPKVTRRGCSIHGTFHKPKVRLSVSTGAVASPPVLAVQIHLIVKTMIDLGLRQKKKAAIQKGSNFVSLVLQHIF